MQRGTIPISTLEGGFDLRTTLESGQSYLWWRADGRDYDPGADDEGWYLTTTRARGEPAVLKIRQRRGRLEWASTIEAEPIVRERLGLGDDLPAIRESAPEETLIRAAYDAHEGLRIVRDPPFPSLISFICSAQMRVSRIHAMQQSLREALGTPVEFDGETYGAYPTPEQLAAATEETLRALKLGYRAPYVTRSAELVATGEASPERARGRDYEPAREYLTRFVGVGEKVADCVLLFSLGYLEAVPLDTWIRRAIAEYFPDCDRGGYAETSRAIRRRLGGEYAGYTQTYLFHHLRTRDGD